MTYIAIREGGCMIVTTETGPVCWCTLETFLSFIPVVVRFFLEYIIMMTDFSVETASLLRSMECDTFVLICLCRKCIHATTRDIE